ncbi:hypothetical protein PGT21_005103 [Puccinia graminis f. sp. tritici]|uniref:Uncharacterized protein n=1 Tax=Puccinia graminis f. sp. tritici TaxID=56615 RepID=A0A5B0PQS5_PUCGR|nr:hypothetical protein PGT21_005103 [Puccinia graminis f. sp. tritici]
MSTNPNNLQSATNQMRRNNADLNGDNAEIPSVGNPTQSNPTLPSTNPTTSTPPTLIQSTAPANSQTPTPIIPIPPKPKNAPAAKAPTGSASQAAATKSASQPSANPKHPLSLDVVATSAEKHRQSAKQSKEIAEILGAKTKTTVDVDKAYAERTTAARASRKREAERDEETALILEKAFAADAEGDKIRADMFYKIYAKMVTSNEPPPTPQEQEEQRLQAEARIGKKNTIAGGTNFNWGDTNSHDDVGFTPYFDKKILELKGPLPLTIFNKAWQDAALTYHAEKRPKTDDNSTEKGLRYTGLPYPSEWCMSYTNADKILRKDGFMVALRYDIRIRANAFAHRVVKNGVKSFSDISIFRQEVYDTAYAEARRYDELIFREVNPYAIGGVRASWDPHTGTKATTKAGANAQVTNHHAKAANPPAQSGSHGPSHLPSKPRESRRGSGYQGKNYNPNHSSGQAHTSGRYHNGEKDGRSALVVKSIVPLP